MNLFLEEIGQQPAAILSTAAWLSSAEGTRSLAAIRRQWETGRYGRILFTGMGSSYFLSSAGAILLSGRGIPALAMNTGELLHHGSALAFRRDTLLVAISQSGESYEIVELVRRKPSGAFLAAITNEAESTLASGADVALLTQAGIEQMTSTKTFITGWQVLRAFAGSISGESSVLPWEETAASIGDILRTADVSSAASFLSDKQFVQLCARGVQMCAASQAALMFMEAAHTPASALTGGDFRHGPMEMVGGGIPVIIFSHSLSSTYPQMRRLAVDVTNFGGKVIFVSDVPVGEDGTFLSLVAPAYDPTLFPITSIVPLQLLVLEFARSKGLNPGGFSHGNKVTRSE